MSYSNLMDAPAFNMNIGSCTAYDITALNTFTATTFDTNTIDAQELTVTSSTTLENAIILKPSQFSVIGGAMAQYDEDSDLLYQFPDVSGTEGQIMSLDGNNNLIWTTGGGGGSINEITNNDGNLSITDTSGNVLINLSQAISTTTINASNRLGCGTVVIPNTLGTNGQVLGVTNNGLEFISQSGSINQITNNDGNLSITDTSGNVIVNLSPDVVISGSLEIDSQYIFPLQSGQPNQVLSMPANGNQCVWQTVGGSTGIEEVNGTTNQITASTQNNAVTLSLPNTLNIPQDLNVQNGEFQALDVKLFGGCLIQSLDIGWVTPSFTIDNKTFQMPTEGSPNQVLTLDSSNNMIWSTNQASGITAINGTINEITADTSNNVCTLSLPNTVAINTLTLNSKTFQDPTTGNPTQILSLDSSNNMIWVNDTAGTGVASINNSDGNISISSPTGDITLDLATSIAVENITIGLAPNNYAMPSSIGTNGQILGINGTTIQWVNDTQGNFTVEGTTDQINANTVNDVCTISFPNTVVFPQDVYVENGTLTTDNISNLNGITTNSLISSGALSMYNSPFQAPGYGTEGSVLTIDTTTDPYSLNWVSPIVVTGTPNQIDATYGSTDVVLSFPNNTQFPTNISTCTIGNSAVSIGSNALGTDPQDVDGTNIGIGANSGSSITTGERNIFIGSQSGVSTTISNDNICIGDYGLNSANPSTGKNICIGSFTGSNVGTNNNNVLVGYQADVVNIGYDNNVNINNVIKMNSAGNVAIGNNSYNNLSSTGRGSLVVSVGDNTLTSIVDSSSNNMVAVGSSSGNNLTTGNYNCLLGNQNLAFSNNITNNNNIVVGNFVGESVASGNTNIILGNLTCNGDDSVNANCNNNIVIGNNSCGTNFNSNSTNNVIIGNNNDVSSVGQSNYLCIKTNVPVLYGNSSQLTVPNFKNIWNTTATVNGQLLASDTNGNLSWYSLPLNVNTSFEFLFNDLAGNSFTLGYQTIRNISGVVTMTIPFDQYIYNGVQNAPYLYPLANTAQWQTTYLLPPQYIPTTFVRFTMPMNSVSLDNNNWPLALTGSFLITVTIDTNGYITLEAWQNPYSFFTNAQPPQQELWQAQVAYMFNALSLGPPFGCAFTCQYLSIYS
jgi:hypothetical protein